MKTQVAIVGAGPAGLLLGHLLRQANVDVVIVERQSADHVLSRIRAGVLENVTTGLMERLGLAERMHAEGLPHVTRYPPATSAARSRASVAGSHER